MRCEALFYRIFSPDQKRCLRKPITSKGDDEQTNFAIFTTKYLFYKNGPKSSYSSFNLKMMLLKIAPKVSKFVASFCKEICWQELSKSPNLVTLVLSHRCDLFPGHRVLWPIFQMLYNRILKLSSHTGSRFLVGTTPPIAILSLKF